MIPFYTAVLNCTYKKKSLQPEKHKQMVWIEIHHLQHTSMMFWISKVKLPFLIIKLLIIILL